MKITTLIPLMVLGASTAAFASPVGASSTMSGHVAVGGALAVRFVTPAGQPYYGPMAQAAVHHHGYDLPPPPLVRDHRYATPRPAIVYPRPSYQPTSYEPRYQEPDWTYQPPATSEWTEYGENMSFVATDGRRSAEIGASEGLFRSIRVTGDSGSPYVMMVQAVFTDGTTHMFMARQTLHRGQSVTFQLDNPSPLLRVTVFTHDNGQLVETSTGTFSVSAL